MESELRPSAMPNGQLVEKVSCYRPDDSRSTKIRLIQSACEARDVPSLVDLATSEHGFVNDEMRGLAWPILLGCARDDTGDASKWESLPKHRDEGQVELDVNRAFIYYPHGEEQKGLETRKEELFGLIAETLRRYPYLCYFQGYHDIVQVFLLVLGAHHARTSVIYMSLLRIRDFMLPSLAAALAQLNILPSLLTAADPRLARHLSLTQPYFALAATLTLYAHDIEDYGDIARLFDFLLAHEPIMSLYLFTTIILERKQELFDIAPDDTDMLHFTLSKLPKPLDLARLVSKTLKLFHTNPPEKLTAWRQISRYSALKTAQSIPGLSEQSLEDAERMFQKQAAEVRRHELQKQVWSTLWKHRQAIGGVGFTVLIGILSWYIRRDYGLRGGSALTASLSRFSYRAQELLSGLGLWRIL